jgi:hypothetical protein
MEDKIHIPVAFIIYNRPDTTIKVFEQIRKAKPSKLYVIADGPNENKPNDKEMCKQTRKIIESVDWDCEVKKNYAEKNMGCGNRPASGLNWVFENEEYAIVLEDDCVPAQSFFWFCQEMLIKYKDDTRIMIVSGNNYNEERKRNDDSYSFCRYGHSWGWATWARSWKHFDFDMKRWPKFRDNGHMDDIFRTKEEINFFTAAFDNVYAKHDGIWDFQFGFAIWANGGLSIVPCFNLVSNIGAVGTHSSSACSFHFRAVNENFRVIKHPDYVLRNNWYDEYHFKNHWNKQVKKNNIFIRIRNKVRRLLKQLLKHFLKPT